MEPAYSTIAVKYVGSTRCQEGLAALQALKEQGAVKLRKAAAVTRSAGGEVNVYPIEDDSLSPHLLRAAIGGFMMGMDLRKRLRNAVLFALLGVAASTVKSWVRRQEFAADLPTVVINESMLYMQILDAEWTAFAASMSPFMTQGKIVLQNVESSHADLARLLGIGAQVRLDAEETKAYDDDVKAENAGADIQRSDFTLIKGIGPILAERLHAGGIHSFRQLAALEIAELAEITGRPETIIANNDWKGQATLLSAGA